MTELRADPSPLDEVRDLSAELNTALAGHDDWAPIAPTAATFVMSARPDGTSILGNSGGWWVTQNSGLVNRDPLTTAAAAVALLYPPPPPKRRPSPRKRTRVRLHQPEPPNRGRS